MVGITCMGLAIGLWLLISAVQNWDWYKGIIDFRVTEILFGEGAARWLCGLMGLAFIGVSIAGLTGLLR